MPFRRRFGLPSEDYQVVLGELARFRRTGHAVRAGRRVSLGLDLRVARQRRRQLAVGSWQLAVGGNERSTAYWLLPTPSSFVSL